MDFTENVLVLSVAGFREADLWVRLLSPTRGILTAFAFGGSRSRRRFPGCLDAFNQVLFRIKSTPGRDFLNLQEGTLVKGTKTLRRDRKRLGMARNCAAFLLAFGVEKEGASKAHHLFSSLLALLEDEAEITPLLPIIFRARLVFDQGYSLDFTACSTCFRPFAPDSAFLLVDQGQLICRHCSTGIRALNKCLLNPKALDLFNAIKIQCPTEWRSLPICHESAKQLTYALDGFIRYHIGLAWENNRFKKV